MRLRNYKNRFSFVKIISLWPFLLAECLLPASTAFSQEDYSTWANSIRIYINTTSSGANISQDVINFPVLVRLNPSVFKGFSAVQPGGADIRFAKSDGTHLPYEIERWQTDAAEVWVLLDTIRAAANTNYFRMYWGKSGVGDGSKASSVFSTVNGFGGVWHLKEAGTATPGNYRDATGLYHGTGRRMSPSSLVPGLIGFCQQFDGVEGHIRFGKIAIHNYPAYTVAMWVKGKIQRDKRIFCESDSTKNNPVFSLGTNRDDATAKMESFLLDDNGVTLVDHSATTGDAFNDAWHHLGWVDDNGSYTMYVDGIPSGSGSYVKSLKLFTTTSIGAIARDTTSLYGFAGAIDEFNLSRINRSAAWMKIAYETQRPAGSCVIIPANQTPPSFTKQPSDVSVSPGAAVKMAVVVSGAPPITYSWYHNAVLTGNKIAGQTADTLSLSNVQTTDTGSYICVAQNEYGAATSTPGKLTITPDIVNPILLRGFAADSNHVRLTISGYKGLPTSASAWYADSVVIWYRSGSFPQTPSLSAVPSPVALPLSAMTAADTFETTLTVPPIGTGTYYCKASVHWRNPAATPPDSIPPFGNDATGAIIAMGDTSKLANPLTMSFKYTPPDSQVKVTIDSLKSPRLRWDLISGANLLYALPGNPFTAKLLTKNQLQGGGDTCIVAVSDPRFSGEEKTVRWMVLLTGKYNNVSDTARDSCKTGAPRPENTIVVNPPDSIWPTMVKLSWRRSPAQTIDNIRIWYGTKKEVPNDSVSPADFNSIIVPGTDSAAMIGHLKDSTLYYFGLQAGRHNVWSTIRDSARVSAMTLPGDSAEKSINNSLVVSGAPEFDSSTNTVKFTWKIADTSIYNLLLYAGIVWQEDSGAFPEPSVQPPVGKIITITDPSQPMTGSIDVDGISMQFDKKYYFGIFLKKYGGKWSRPTDSSKGTFTIPKPAVFSVTYFGDSDEVVAFGGNVVLKKIGEFTDIVNAKVYVAKLSPPPSGLIPVSDGFRFDQIAPPSPIGLGLRYDSIPAPYKLRDIRMYHYDAPSQRWYVDTIPERDSVTRIVSIRIPASSVTTTFLLAIDIIRPKISVQGDTASPVLLDGTDIAVKGVVEDNIANPGVMLLAGRGDDSLSYKKTIQPPAPIDLKIPGVYVQGDCGMRILIVVNDGRFADTVNISRDIRLSGADDFIPEKEQWMPIGTSVKLDTGDVRKVLNEYAPEGAPWQYDPRKFRLFRWLQGDWQEYSTQEQSRFSFIPGRLMWLKTRTTDCVRFDSGRTVSLKRPYTISLRSKDWTDFILPYRFDIYIGDILSANDSVAAKTLQFYVWNKNQAGRYTLKGLYLPSNPAFNDTKSTLAYLKNGDGTAYCVYNPLDKDVELRIPPIPTALSPLPAERKPQAAAAAGWSIAVRSYLRRDNEELSPVFCAYDAGGGVSAAYPLPPSWGNVHVGITGANRTGVYGNIVTGELKNDGYAYQLVFINNEAAATTISYTVERCAGTAVSIGVLDPQNNGAVSMIDSTLHVTVEADSREYRWIAVGNSQYIEGLRLELTKGEFALVRLAPNPFRGVLRIGYKIPYAGITSVRCELIDQLGRVVWSAGGNRNVRPGANEFVWNPRKRTLAAGAYIVRLTGLDDKGKKRGERLTRVMYLP